MADFINVGFGNMVNGDKIISMVSTDAAPVKRMIQNARDEGKAVDATCGRRTRTVLVMESYADFITGQAGQTAVSYGSAAQQAWGSFFVITDVF